MNKVLTIEDASEWNQWLHKFDNNQKDVYYTPEYYSLYQHNGDGLAKCFIYYEDEKIVLYPFLQNPITTLGYDLDREYYDIQGAYGYNGIIATCKDADFIARFHECFDAFCQEQAIVAEFSRFHSILGNQVLASPNMKTFYSRHTVKLNLTPSLDDIWMKSFSSKNRNVIKKAQKEGVTIVESKDYEFFRQMYNQTMKNVEAEAFYFFPKSYYDEFQQNFGEDVILCFAIYEGKPISGSMFMFSKDYAHYHLSGRDKDYYKIAANNLVLWYGIQKAKERGCKWFHLGGGTTGEENDPLLHFKRNFSKEEGDFWFGKRVHNPTAYGNIVAQWMEKYPESYEQNKIKLLGYREF